MKRHWIALALTACVLFCGNASDGPDPALTVAMPPGRIADFERVLAARFEEETRVRIETIGLRSADQVARVRIESGSPTLDVLWIDFGEAQLLGREGLLASVDEADIPNLEFVQEEARNGLGIAPVTFASALGFLYNTERLPEPPRSWRELWDPKYRSEIALFDFGSTLGPALLVMAARIHGGGIDDIDAGFQKIAELSEHASVIQTSGPANNMLVAQGEAGLTFGLASQARSLQGGGAPVAWLVPEEGAIALPQGFQITAGSARLEVAQEFLNHALGLEAQTALARELLLVASHRHVRLDLDPETSALVPIDNIVYLDFDAIGAKRGEWTDRFHHEILSP